jgi:AmiR/NasT family two-component response regulator
VPKSSLTQPGIRPASPLYDKRVVVAESEGIIIMMLDKALQQAGARIVASCRTPAEAVKLVAREQPDLVLVGLPPEVDPAMVRAVREAVAVEPPCLIVMANFATRGSDDELRAAGASAIIHKPFTINVLLPLLIATYQAHCTT